MLIKQAGFRKRVRHGLRKIFASVPRETPFGIYRAMIDCDPTPAAA
jgi:hypothetical protein